MSRIRSLAIVVVVAMVLVAGCAGVDRDDADEAVQPEAADGTGEAEDPPTGEAGSRDSDADYSAGNPVEAPDRELIRTGVLHLEVEDFTSGRETIGTIARDHGGFVSDSSRESAEYHNETRTTGTVTVRVPSESFGVVFAEAGSIGTMRAAETTTEDMTEQLVDVEARLENLRAERERLRTLFDEANETNDVLAVQSELSRVQEDLERLEARQRALEDRVAYATITVHLAEPKPEPSAEHRDADWYETDAFAAFRESVSGVVTVLRAAVVAGAYVLPYLATFGLPVAGAFALYRRRSSDGSG